MITVVTVPVVVLVVFNDVLVDVTKVVVVVDVEVVRVFTCLVVLAVTWTVKVEVVVMVPLVNTTVTVLVSVKVVEVDVVKGKLDVKVLTVKKVLVCTGTDWHNNGLVCPPSHGTDTVVMSVLPGMDVMIGQLPAVCPPPIQGNGRLDGKAPIPHQVYKLSRADQLREFMDAGAASYAAHKTSTDE